jgi:hypothetical protein
LQGFRLFLRGGFVVVKNPSAKTETLFRPVVVPQNIENTQDLIATADRGAGHAQRIINLKN